MHATTEQQVWDPLVRLFHWGLAAAFAVAWFTEHQPHVLAGYAALTLVGVRIVWGFIGPRHARFSDFVRPPGEVMAHVREMLQGRMKREAGHNPLAGWVYVLLFLSLIGLTVSGMATLAAEESAGPLAGIVAGEQESEIRYVNDAYEDHDHDEDHEEEGHAQGGGRDWEEIHEFFANLTLALVLVHLAGVLLGSLMQGQNLVAGMITGRKQVDDEDTQEERS
ncbi:cytochrome b/b6 domain-containing protein [Ectothiorhodospira mobilis]|uniref:cytochrome b/b6 domain-containing protein n=1 Tax=Ectothiorhodospira mobilis TaxID=195064 RepID=UPI001905E06E|nr:cytochrome b/b6 domain-containing protein [Ectothiorhodospira mobilis]MBK1691016.1 hypothetical protein [Ectothiorhodospira mobilis]